ncbi:MAG: glycosyltransferase, partial [bacterium]
ACALPVVSSDLSGIPELVEHGRTGYLVAPRDVQGLADALGRLAADPDLRHRLGRAGRAKVLEQFHLEHNAAALARLFTDQDLAESTKLLRSNQTQ